MRKIYLGFEDGFVFYRTEQAILGMLGIICLQIVKLEEVWYTGRVIKLLASVIYCWYRLSKGRVDFGETREN